MTSTGNSTSLYKSGKYEKFKTAYYTLYIPNENLSLLCNYSIFTKTVEVALRYSKKANWLKLRILLVSRQLSIPLSGKYQEGTHASETRVEFAQITIIEHKDKQSPLMYHVHNYNDNEDFLIFRLLSNHSHPCTSWLRHQRQNHLEST